MKFISLEDEITLRLAFKSVLDGPEGLSGLLQAMGELADSLQIAGDVLKEYSDEQEKKK
jgi:hypothetical protein